MRTTHLNVRGMRCAGCVNHVQKNLRAVPGVSEATVNLALEQAMVKHDPTVAPLQALLQAVRAAGYEAEEISAASGDQAAHEHHATTPAKTHVHADAPTRDWWRRVLPGAVLGLPVVYLGMAGVHESWAIWTQVMLATVVQVWLGWPYYRGAFKAAAHFRTDMDTLVALGTSVAYGYSVVAAIQHNAHLYFDTSVVILVLISVGKLLEAKARHSAAAAIRGLMSLQPPEATLIADGQEVRVPVAEVEPGDIVLVRPGQRVPVDGLVTEGASAIDQAMVTGESIPVEVSPGSSVIAGTLNRDGVFRFRATHTGAQSMLARIVELVRQAQGTQARVQRIADAVAAVFVPIVLLCAVGAALGWGLLGQDWAMGLYAAVAVLIVACPCALGLATPAAIMVGSGLGAGMGILIKDAAAFERAGRLTHAVLDKTGTLTTGRPEVVALRSLRSDLGDDQLLALAASVEISSAHPLAQAMVRQARARNLTLTPVHAFASITAGGVRGTVAGQTILVGKPDTLREQGVADLDALSGPMTEMTQGGRTVVAVAADRLPVGLIALADTPREEAAEVVAELHKLGLKVTLMTGDNRATAQAVAGQLGIDEVLAEVLPEDKESRVRALRESGAVVAMVGDGINDAPALAAADVGIAVAPAGGGTDIAQEAGQIVLIAEDLRCLPRAIRLSRATLRRIHAGLFWAFIYNLVLIPLAVAGHLDPMLAAGAMAFSSVSVVLNALWLRWSWRA